MISHVRVNGLTITFSGVDVVKGVDLEMRGGEIHALVGENGAGKSSLAKAIAGVNKPRLGSIELNGHEVRFRNPNEALQAGVALIHQEPLTFPDLSVAENIFAGHAPRRGGLIDWKALYSKSKELLAQVGSSLDPSSAVAGISVAQQQRIELASALSHEAKVWIFDETTAPLTPNEVAELFVIMRRLRDEGQAILVVTHHLHEVFEIADRITILRDGSKIGERLTSETTPAEIVTMMVGREISGERFTGVEPGAEVLAVSGLTGPGFREINLHVRKGEILGIGGLVGAGRTEFVRALFGITRPTEGRILLEGQEVFVFSPRHAQRQGIALVPEDRRHDGLLLPQSIAFNATLPSLKRLSRKGWLKKREINEQTETYAQRLRLVHQSIEQPAGQLSGGNQQKIVLSKWLMTGPMLLILDEPTRGVDVGAKHDVHELIRSLANEGLAVLMISSDLPELLRLSDRVAVMRQGTIVAEFEGHTATEESVMLAATGQGVA